MRGGQKLGYLDNAATYVIAGAGSLYAFVTGNTSLAFQILLGIMTIDFVSGALKGMQKKNLRSIIANLGIMKKAGLLLAISFALMLDQAVNGGTPVFATMMTWASIGNESLSVIENLESLGVKMPTAITDKLGQVISEAEKIHKDKE